jgi:hypothetical protein
MMIGMGKRRRLRQTLWLQRDVRRLFENRKGAGGARPAPPGIFPYEI